MILNITTRIINVYVYDLIKVVRIISNYYRGYPLTVLVSKFLIH